MSRPTSVCDATRFHRVPVQTGMTTRFVDSVAFTTTHTLTTLLDPTLIIALISSAIGLLLIVGGILIGVLRQLVLLSSIKPDLESDSIALHVSRTKPGCPGSAICCAPRRRSGKHEVKHADKRNDDDDKDANRFNDDDEL